MAYGGFRGWDDDEEDKKKKSTAPQIDTSAYGGFQPWEEKESKRPTGDTTIWDDPVADEKGLEPEEKQKGFFSGIWEGVKTGAGMIKDVFTGEDPQERYNKALGIEPMSEKRAEGVIYGAEVLKSEASMIEKDLDPLIERVTALTGAMKYGRPEERREVLGGDLTQLTALKTEWYQDEKKAESMSFENWLKDLHHRRTDMRRAQKMMDRTIENAQNLGKKPWWNVWSMAEEFWFALGDRQATPAMIGSLLSLSEGQAEQRVLEKGERDEQGRLQIDETQLSQKEKATLTRYRAERLDEQRELNMLEVAAAGTPHSLSFMADLVIVSALTGGTGGIALGGKALTLKAIPRLAAASAKKSAVSISTVRSGRAVETAMGYLSENYVAEVTEDGVELRHVDKDKEMEVPEAMIRAFANEFWLNFSAGFVGEVVTGATVPILKPLQKTIGSKPLAQKIIGSKGGQAVSTYHRFMRTRAGRSTYFGEYIEEITQQLGEKAFRGAPVTMSSEELAQTAVSIGLLHGVTGLPGRFSNVGKEFTQNDIEALNPEIRKALLEGKEAEADTIQMEQVKNVFKDVAQKIESGELKAEDIQSTRPDYIEAKLEQFEAAEKRILKETENLKKKIEKGEVTPDQAQQILNDLVESESIKIEEALAKVWKKEDAKIKAEEKKVEAERIKKDPIKAETPLTPSIQEAKAEGKSFNKWVESLMSREFEYHKDEKVDSLLYAKTIAGKNFIEEFHPEWKKNPQIAQQAVDELGVVYSKELGELVKSPNLNEYFSKNQYGDSSILQPQTKTQLKELWERDETKKEAQKKKTTEDEAYEAVKKKMKKRLTPAEQKKALEIAEKEAETGLKEGGEILSDRAFSRVKVGEAIKKVDDMTETERIITAGETLAKLSKNLDPKKVFSKTEIKKREAQMDYIANTEVALPEIVRFLNNLTDGEKIRIFRKLQPGVRGDFYHEKGTPGSERIRMLASLARDPQLFSKTLAHEIGHYVDAMPDYKIHGTFLGHLKGVKDLARKWGELENADLKKEMYELSKEWRPYDESTATQNHINYRNSPAELYADFISILFLNPGLLKTKAPKTFGAWLAFSRETKPAIHKEFDKVWELLHKPKDELHAQRIEDIRKMFNEGDGLMWGAGHVHQGRIQSLLSTLAEGLDDTYYGLKKALYDTKTPLMRAEKTIERETGTEIDTKPSDAIQGLTGIKDVKVWFTNEHYQPIVDQAQAMGFTRHDIDTYSFLNRVKEERGEITTTEIVEGLDDLTLNELFVGDADQSDMVFSRLTSRFTKGRAKDKRKTGDVKIVDLLTEDIKANKSTKEALAAIQGLKSEQIIENLKKHVLDLVVDPDDTSTAANKYRGNLASSHLGKLLDAYLPMKAQIANPLGYSTETAAETLNALKTQYGEKKWKQLQEIHRKLHDVSKKLLQNEEVVNYYGQETVDRWMENKSYVKFGVNHYYNQSVSADIKRQSGTVKSIGSPTTHTLLQNLAMIEAAETNSVRMRAIDMLLQHQTPESKIFGNIEKARLIRLADGTMRIDRDAYNHKTQDVVSIKREGVSEHYVMDKEMAQAIRDEIHNFGKGTPFINLLAGANNKVFRPLFITFNLGFSAVFNPVRDFKRFYHNSPHMNLLETFGYWLSTVSDSYQYNFKGEATEIVKEMQQHRMLPTQFLDYETRPEGKTDLVLLPDQLQEYFKNNPELTKKEKSKITQASKSVVGFFTKWLQMWELNPKLAGFKSLKAKETFMLGDGSYDYHKMRVMVKNYFGSPDYKRRGSLHALTNNVFLFSNARKEGWRGDISMLAGTSPMGKAQRWKTWSRIIATELVPLTIMYMVRAGIAPFDDEEAFGDWRKTLRRIPKSEFITHQVFSLGNIEDMATYIPFARNESNRLYAGMLWYAMDMMFSEEEVGFEEARKEIIKSVSKEIPGFHPLIQTSAQYSQMKQGQNPYDSFRGRTIFNPYDFNTMSESEKNKVFFQYALGNMGASVIWGPLAKAAAGEYEPDRHPTPLEKAHNVPLFGTAIRRIVRTSNWGTIEQTQSERKIGEATRARELRETRQMMEDDAKIAFDRNARLKDIEAKGYEYQVATLGEEPREGWSGADLTKAGNVRKEFKEALYREWADRQPDRRRHELYNTYAINIHTNAEKARTIRQEAQDFGWSKEEVESLLKNLYRAEIISNQFLDDHAVKIGIISPAGVDRIKQNNDRTAYNVYKK